MGAALLSAVGIHDQFKNVIIAEDMNGFRMTYLMQDGTLVPGRIWRCLVDGGPRSVDLFLPIPDGIPAVLAVNDAC